MCIENHSRRTVVSVKKNSMSWSNITCIDSTQFHYQLISEAFTTSRLNTQITDKPLVPETDVFLSQLVYQITSQRLIGNITVTHFFTTDLHLTFPPVNKVNPPPINVAQKVSDVPVVISWHRLWTICCQSFTTIKQAKQHSSPHTSTVLNRFPGVIDYSIHSATLNSIVVVPLV